MSEFSKTSDILKMRAIEKEREEKRRELELKKKQLEEVSTSIRLITISTFLTPPWKIVSSRYNTFLI